MGIILDGKTLADKILADIKIEIHNKISNIESFVDLENLKAEFIDRFGPLEDDLILYMYEKLFYSLCKQAKVENIDIKPKLVTLTPKPLFSCI